MRMVEDSLDVETGEGAGTIGVELARFPEKLDAVAIAIAVPRTRLGKISLRITQVMGASVIA